LRTHFTAAGFRGEGSLRTSDAEAHTDALQLIDAGFPPRIQIGVRLDATTN